MSPKAYIILVLAVMFVAIIAFGNDPMEDYHKRRLQRASMKLIDKINEANKKKSGMFSSMQHGTGDHIPGTIDWEKDGKYGKETDPNQSGSGSPIAGANLNNNIPRGTTYNSNPNPFMNANPYMRPQPNQITAPNPAQDAANANNPRPQSSSGRDGYYPPPPLRKGGAMYGPQSDNDSIKNLKPGDAERIAAALSFDRRKNSEHGNPNFTTDEGHSLAYYGTKVYTFADDGKVVPMPDGKYSMFNGRWTMVVRGGQQTIANADKPFWRQ